MNISATGGTGPYTGTGDLHACGWFVHLHSDRCQWLHLGTQPARSASPPRWWLAPPNASPILVMAADSTVTVSAYRRHRALHWHGNGHQLGGSLFLYSDRCQWLHGTTTGNITQPSALSASSSKTAILCNGGSSTVTVSATGGTAPYSGTGTFSRSAGTYSFTVTDANSCTATTTGNITQPSALTLGLQAGACSGGSNGSDHGHFR